MLDPTQTRIPLPRKIIAVNTFGFLIAFAAWVMFGPSVRVIVEDLQISEGMAIWLKTAPILTGSILRAPIGVITDRFGARRVFTALLAIGAVSVSALSFSTSVVHLLVGGVIMGVVGTTFVVGVQSVSSWSPPSRQGLALGFFGFGIGGTAVSTLLIPLMLDAMHWRMMFRIYAVMLVICTFLYWFGVRDVAREVGGAARTFRSLLAPLADRRTWMFGVYYMATFGVFVTGALCFGDLYIDRYGLDMKLAGALATTFTFTAPASWVFGGWLSDRFGARPVLTCALATMVCTLAPVLLALPLWPTVALIFISAIAMGSGMGATYKYIPEYFPDNVGAVGGLVGAMGGMAGFFLPLLGSLTQDLFDAQIAQLFPLFGMVLLAALVLAISGRGGKARAVTPEATSRAAS